MKSTQNTNPFIAAAHVQSGQLGNILGWHQFIYLSHNHGNGFATEIAFGYNDPRIKIRSSLANNWTDWRII